MALRPLRAFANIVSTMRSRYFTTAGERGLAARYRALNQARHGQGDAPLVALQCVEDSYYLCLFGEIITALRDHGSLRAEQYILRSFRLGGSQSFGNFLSVSLYANLFSDWKWARLYGSFCDRVAYRSAALISPFRAIQLTRAALRIWRGLRSVDEVAALSIDNIKIGDLIGDSFLRFKPSVSLDVKDPYLLVIIRQALKDLYLAKRYFSTKRPSLYLTSYTCYVQHGIAARVAVSLGIPTLSFGSYQQLATKITPDNLSHSKPGQDYATDFLTLPDREEKIDAAWRVISGRISGKNDLTTLYMKNSAYEVRSTNVPDVGGAAVIFLHDFFDSPHCYRWMIFHDFWEWANVTIATLEEAGLPFFVKPHPNQVVASATHIEVLKQNHPQLRMIPPEVTNKQLADAGMRCAITVHGTIASEAAFLGVPSISCGDNPHIGFEFTRTARSREEYRDFLFGFQNYHPSVDDLRRQACIFYYMHNMNLDQQAAALRDEFVRIRTRMIDLHPTKKEDLEEIIGNYRELSENAGFRRFAAELYHQLRFHGTSAIQGESQGSTECSQMPQY
jgi:hypothetical protein